jgi:membrane protein YqaA with SNARE-associated domain
VPPFFATTVAAGALKIDFGRFLGAAIVGRLLHFSGVALAPLLVHAYFR